MSILTLRPRLDGDTIENTTTPTGYVPHCDLVNEVTPDSATYISGNVSNVYLTDLFRINLPTIQGTISSIIVYARIASPIGVDSNAKIAIKIGGTNYYGSEISPTNSYVTYSETWSINPYSGNAWNFSDIVDLQIGASLCRRTYMPRCTQIYIEINYTIGNELLSTTIRPNGNGDLIELSPSAGDNFECVDEIVADDNTTYVSKGGTSSYVTDLYNLNDPIISGKILYIKAVERGYIASSNYYHKPVIKTHGVTYYGTDETGNSYSEHIFYWGNNPYTGTPWTMDEINSLQAGVCLKYGRCTQVYVEVVYYLAGFSRSAQIIGLVRR